MNVPKVILHRLGSPSDWESERTERVQTRSRLIRIATAVGSLCIAAAAFHRPPVVEDYTQRTRDLAASRSLESVSYLADSRSH